MKCWWIIFGSFLLVLSCSTPKSEGKKQSTALDIEQWAIQSEEDWLRDVGLMKGESILHDPEKQCLYLSNGNQYAAGTEGFISKISHTGELINLRWVDSLNRPTGMALKDSMLYVADVNVLLTINSNNGTIIHRYPEPIQHAGLNDVAVNEEGEIFVTASFVHAVLKLTDQGLEVWAQSDSLLQWANGIIAVPSQLIVAGMDISQVSTTSEQITPILLNPRVQDFDGIVSDGRGGYFLTTVEQSGLYYLDAHNGISNLLDGEDYFGDLTFISDQGELFIPRGNHRNGAYYISKLNLR